MDVSDPVSRRCDSWSACRKTEIFPVVCSPKCSCTSPRPLLVVIIEFKAWLLAKRSVNVRGWQGILLSRSATDEAGLGTSGRVFRPNLMLETLAVYDIFGGSAHGRGGRTAPIPPDA